MLRSSRGPLYREFISILGGMQVVKTWTPSLIRDRLRAMRRTVSILYSGQYSLDESTRGADASNCCDVFTVIHTFPIYSKCGILDPSWTEFHHFTKFLNIQLNSCEKSVFCDETLVGDVMSGLKGFVVKFMIRMSQVFLCIYVCV